MEKVNTYNTQYFDFEKDQYIETPWTIIGAYFG
jgi:hypothetical protein